MNNSRILTLYIACSLDGYIAAPGDDLSFLNAVAREGEDYGYQAFLDTVDTVIMGGRTYEKVQSMGVEFPHGDRETYIITRRPQPDKGSLLFFTGDLVALVSELKSRPGGTIFCDGGAWVANTLWKAGLMDRLTLSLIPVLLGNGIRLFGEGLDYQALKLDGCQAYDSGLVQLRYSRVESVVTG